MKNIDRVMAAVQGLETDHKPFALILSLYGSKLTNTNTDIYYKDPEKWYKGQEKTVELFDPDILVAPFSFAREAEAFGSEVIYLNNYAPNVKKPFIADLTQIDNLKIPDFDSSVSVKFFQRSLDLLVENYGKERAIASPIQSPCDIPATLMGIEKWIDTLLFHSDYAKKLLNITIKHFVKLGNDYLNRGANFLVVTLNFTNPSIITEKIFLMLKPYLIEAFEQINGPIVIHNGGCILKSFIPYYVTLPNVIAIAVDPRESLSESRKLMGEKIVLMGNIDGPNLDKLSTDKVEEICLKILEDRKNDNHYIFCSTSADIPNETPIEVIEEIVAAIKRNRKN